MVDLIAGVGGGAFVLASLLVGGRLLLLAARHRGLPELAIGGGLLLMGGIGYPMIVLAQVLPDLPDAARAGFVAAHILCNVVGFGGVGAFTWKVFRPGRAWALALALAIPAVELGAAVLQAADPGLLAFATRGEGSWHFNTFFGGLVMLWSGGESVAYARALARRRRVGLGDPVVANRILLWGFAILVAACISLLTLALEPLGLRVMGSLAGALIVGPLGLVSSAALYLAFMPPRAYTRWILARAGEA